MGQGCHVCAIHTRHDEFEALCRDLIVKGTEGDYKWILVYDATTSTVPALHVSDELPPGALLTASDAGLQAVPFSASGAVARLQELAEHARDEGFAGTFFLIQMSALLHTASGLAHHGEFEAALEGLATSAPIRLACVYNRSLFPGPTLLDALRTHRHFFLANRVIENPHYLPPTAFLGGDAQEQFDVWLQSVARQPEAGSGLPRPTGSHPPRRVPVRRRSGALVANLTRDSAQPKTGDQRRWKIRCFGNLRVYREDGAPVQWNAVSGATLKTKTLFAFLLHRGQAGATVEAIADLLWPESKSTEQSLNRLYHTVHCLRLVLSPDLKSTRQSDLVTCHDRRYFLNLPQGTWIDVPLFEQLCRQGEKLLQAGRLDEALACHLSADALYTGPLFSDIPMEYAENHERDWCWSRRYWLEEIHVKMMTYTARLLRLTGQAERAVDFGERALKTDPCFEPAHAELMHVFHALGRRDAFERQYQLYRNALRHFDQSEPSREVRSLYASLADSFAQKPPQPSRVQAQMEYTRVQGTRDS